MKKEKTFRYPVALTIAGSDSSGGAGIQADLKTFSALGVYGASVITAVTAQNTLGVRGIQTISSEILKGQLDAVFEDLPIDAVKIGMLHTKKAALLVAEALDFYQVKNIVLDPVMISTSGSRLMEDETIEIIVNQLFNRIDVLTPNLDEASFLTGITIRTEKEMEQAAHILLHKGCRAVVMKGGHLDKGEMTDILFAIDQPPHRLTIPAIYTENSHGTGCTLSSAMAAYMALGKTLPEAFYLAKRYISDALSAGADVKTGHGHGPLNHFFAPFPLLKIETEK